MDQCNIHTFFSLNFVLSIYQLCGLLRGHVWLVISVKALVLLMTLTMAPWQCEWTSIHNTRTLKGNKLELNHHWFSYLYMCFSKCHSEKVPLFFEIAVIQLHLNLNVCFLDIILTDKDRMMGEIHHSVQS